MFRKRFTFTVLIAVLIAVAALAVPGRAQETYEVSVQDNFFSPDEITINVGDTIEWVSTGTTFAHNVVADDGSFDSGVPTSSAFTFSVTFDEPGTYQYYCELHGAPGGIGMSGVIIVVDPTATPPTDTPEPPTPTNTSEPPTDTPEPPTPTHTSEPPTDTPEPPTPTNTSEPPTDTPVPPTTTNTSEPPTDTPVPPTPTNTSEPPTETPSAPTATSTDIPPTATPTDGEPLDDPIPSPIPQGNRQVKLEVIATGLTAPNWGTYAPGCFARKNAGILYVSDQDGILWAIDTFTGDKRVFLDVSDRLVSLGAFGEGSFDERGFLGVAFHPDFGSNGLLYTYTSEPVNGPADFSTMPVGEAPNHQSVILEWEVQVPCGPDSVVDPTTVREVLRIDEPQFNHDGGALNFGPDGYLYISLGDGGAADDQGVGHGDGNGQNPATILGSLLRIDPAGSNSANGQYGIPADNPFVGNPDGADEVFVYGLRNPFRFSFDSESGDLYIADVGQNDIEEVNFNMYDSSTGTFADAGGNYGWNLREGSFCFDPNGTDQGFVYVCPPQSGLIDPVAEYDHDEGLSIIGGFVYHGSKNLLLQDLYIFGDWAQNFGGNNGRLFYLENGQMYEFQILGQENVGYSLNGFGQDAIGEIYLMGNSTGTPFGETGVVLRIGPAFFEAELDGAQEVPPVETDAFGYATFAMKKNGAISFGLNVAFIEEVFAAHIHCAPAGENGPVGVTLFSGETVSIEKGVLARGKISGPDPDNGCGWADMSDIVTAMQNGNAYVNVHTNAHPSGEIRGQIR
jgi:plastocyanin/glucose/arabinose dehydrogenase